MRVDEFYRFMAVLLFMCCGGAPTMAACYVWEVLLQRTLLGTCKDVFGWAQLFQSDKENREKVREMLLSLNF